MTRLPRLIALCLVFGSMWLHGVIEMPSDDHVMATQSCLEYCLSSVHIDSADEAIVGTAVSLPSPITENWGQNTSVATDVSGWATDSHHDPGQILTIQKRE